MDYRKMLAVHTESKADITISVIPVNKENTGGFGILQTDNDGRITDFVEKPQTEEELQRLAVPEDTFTSRGIDPRGRQHIASMGIYIFNRALLEQVLSNESHVDFGLDIIPKSLHTHRVFAYFFDSYWEDIGTIQAFYQANIQLTDVSPQFNFYDERTPIYTHRRHLPSTKVNNSSVRSSILSEGSIIDDSEIDRSIVGIRTVISARTRVYQSILMGADFYETNEQKTQNQKAGIPDIGLGRGCLIRGAIIDKNARIGEDSIIANTEQKSDFDGESYFIRDGIVIIPKDGIIKPGTVI
jgi:glucose-1-phosphate adenylyltransferase